MEDNRLKLLRYELSADKKGLEQVSKDMKGNIVRHHIDPDTMYEFEVWVFESLSKVTGIKIFEEKPGVISEGPCWVCFYGPFMYTAPTLLELVEALNTEWGHEKHLVG